MIEGSDFPSLNPLFAVTPPPLSCLTIGLTVLCVVFLQSKILMCVECKLFIHLYLNM